MDRATSVTNMRALDSRASVSKPAKGSGNRKLDEATEKLVRQDLLEATKSFRQIAALRKVNKSTVERIANKMLFEPAPDDPEDSEELEFKTRLLKGPKLCPGCQRESIYQPCVQCAAQASSKGVHRSQVLTS